MIRRQFEKQFAWASNFIPEMKRIVGPHLLTEASFEEDTEFATDLVVLRAGDIRINCRVRTAKTYHIPGAKHQFTIRCRAAYGGTTEYEKLMTRNRVADWMFYGIAESDDAPYLFRAHHLIDLNAWRRQWAGHPMRGRLESGYPCRMAGRVENGDGRTAFVWFDLRSFGPVPPLIIESSEDFEPPQEGLVIQGTLF